MKYNMKHAVWYGALVAVQLIIVLGFFAQRMYTMRVGREVVLETRAVDPRDLIRGQYVDLRYEIGLIPAGMIEQKNIVAGDTMFVSLQYNEYTGVYHVSRISKTPPNDFELFIRGTVHSGLIDDARNGNSLQVGYGIERYFIPATTPIETWRSGRVRVHVRVDKNGNAVIERLEVVDDKIIHQAGQGVAQ